MSADRIRIGCSGWDYRHWRGAFYPQDLPVKRWFDHYAATFDTVEINATFYRLPKAETFTKWREQAPSGFCYAVKANRFITQAKKLKDAGEAVTRMFNAMHHLGRRLGPILYQLPPNLRLNLERLDSFLAVLPPGFTHVFEFRDKSWYVSETLELLDKHRACFCVHDMKGSAAPRWVSGKAAYVRFHGTGGKYVGHYSKSDLEDWADWMKERAKKHRHVWAYFNNDVHAHAVKDALALKELVGQ